MVCVPYVEYIEQNRLEFTNSVYICVSASTRELVCFLAGRSCWPWKDAPEYDLCYRDWHPVMLHCTSHMAYAGTGSALPSCVGAVNESRCVPRLWRTGRRAFPHVLASSEAGRGRLRVLTLRGILFLLMEGASALQIMRSSLSSLRGFGHTMQIYRKIYGYPWLADSWLMRVSPLTVLNITP